MGLKEAFAAAACWLALPAALAPALAAPVGETVADEQGVLNPEELTVQYWAARAEDGRFDPGMCMYGYPIAKMGWHEPARKIFERCAQHGNPYAMPWAAWTEENGYDRPSDPAAAAEWDRKLAETGSALGQLNYGLDVLRGHGVPRDPALGKALVDRAAAAGESTARDLAAHDYDPASVTPTADLAHYRHPQF
ncbi:TPR repeat protein [Rhodoblastus acidophilus]|uniref:tetratricopeptide repeat protein n=1 Tax=Rhodoblastus acidophilus TaxID=1074 RepID=UPI002224BD4B|nr:sel1 repeat family protein [Rhodoblastus acidophilus]MCW2317421.1 TPR repeat protein [Rhodoblastus acidophilus]